MTVSCWREDCTYCRDGYCLQEYLTIDEYGECTDFERVYDTDEWQKPFWKRMLDKDNNRVCRVKYFGKEVEIEGVKFFVESRSAFANATEETTGFSAGGISDVPGIIEKIKELLPQAVPALDKLPIATYNEITRKFTYEEKE